MAPAGPEDRCAARPGHRRGRSRRSRSTRRGWRSPARLRERRIRRAGDEIESIALQALRAKMGDLRHGSGVDELAAAVVDGTTDPYAAADQVVAALA